MDVITHIMDEKSCSDCNCSTLPYHETQHSLRIDPLGPNDSVMSQCPDYQGVLVIKVSDYQGVRFSDFPGQLLRNTSRGIPTMQASEPLLPHQIVEEAGFRVSQTRLRYPNRTVIIIIIIVLVVAIHRESGLNGRVFHNPSHYTLDFSTLTKCLGCVSMLKCTHYYLPSGYITSSLDHLICQRCY